MDVEKSPTRREEVRTRVLVVDDEPLIRWAASSTLSDAGFQVIEATNVAVHRIERRLARRRRVHLVPAAHEQRRDCGEDARLVVNDEDPGANFFRTSGGFLRVHR